MKLILLTFFFTILILGCKVEDQDCKDLPPENIGIFNPYGTTNDGHYDVFELPLILHLNEGYDIGDTLVYVITDTFAQNDAGNLSQFFIDLKSFNPSHPQGISLIHSNLTGLVQRDYDVHPNGWIVFATWDKTIFKIKNNGDSLTFLSQDLTSSFFESVNWNYAGDKILVSYYPGLSPIMDTNGTILEYMPDLGVSPHKSWKNKNGYLLNSDQDSIYYLDTQLAKHNIMKRPKNGYSTYSWIGDNQIAVSIGQQPNGLTDEQGLFFVDIYTGATDKILTACDTDFFANVCYAPKVDRVYFLRFEKIPVNKYTIKTKSTICSIRPSGSDYQEHKLQ
jgi:hypothetical protein